MYLYHYFERSKGPFLTVSELAFEEALNVLTEIQKANPNLVNPRKEWFIKRRYEMEALVREKFIIKGGKPLRKAPFYMTLGEDPYMNTWYNEPESIKIHISEFDLSTVSFTYGDMFPVFNPELDDGMEYRGNVYFFDEIVGLIEKYGYPEKINYSFRDGIFPKDAPVNHYLKYVEAHVWSDDVPEKYRKQWMAVHAT